ncbi:hypothetical protein JAAARDRAFT_29791 [Jaapia argillacea MUCL 33604]|uniref:Transmembrane protein 135 N-terminal domain-containing protein n=1 Tax=Jaapia argillacea MUCL 33604 TaxID=933084 RepID=A0A067Q9M4_9AGAM|nr:hypothetical protein JAAARDRAFT_29791 [Jaapia argillacea MUCL 33604]
MSSSSSPPTSSRLRTSLAHATVAVDEFLHSFADDHPLQVSLRTYALALSLSLTPALVPFLTSAKSRTKLGGLNGVKKVLSRELGVTGFAFAITVAVGGGAALQHLLRTLHTDDDPRSDPTLLRSLKHKLRRWFAPLVNLSPVHQSFISNLISSLIAITLLQSRRRPSPQAPIPMTPPTPPPSNSYIPSSKRPSPTLDLTLLIFVRAMDTAVQSIVFKRTQNSHSSSPLKTISDASGKLTQIETHEAKEMRQKLTTKLDALFFWMSSARIMWCFFYQPERLPRSYVKWITTLADIDPRLLSTLRYLRSRTWSYTSGLAPPTDPYVFSSLSTSLGLPPSWGDPAVLPAFGGEAANEVWKRLGVEGRWGVGGAPCEIIHGGKDRKSCAGNAGRRGVKAFGEAFLIYLPVHILPTLLTRPSHLLSPHTLLRRLLSTLRSATFLSTFVSTIWFTICLTRTLFLPHLLSLLPPQFQISHDILDGPFGCILAGCLTCGSSIWIEEGRRRGEMMLYVLPRAVRTLLADGWVRSGKKGVVIAERLAFMLSLSTLLTSAIHHPDSLRGLSRWTLSFIMNGPNAGFWMRKRKQKDTGAPPSPLIPSDDTMRTSDS